MNPGRFASRFLLPIKEAVKLRVVSARLLVLLVAIPLMDCECSGSSGCADEDYDTPRTVTPKFRVEILDSLDAPVADVAVRI